MPEEPSVESLSASLDAAIEELSEQHRMHRKVRFLLEMRGLLVINKLEGDYVEFGVYRGEMMYAAKRVIGQWVNRFIGLDTFSGLPDPVGADEEKFVFEEPGFMASPKETAAGLMQGTDTVLIEGDFREEEVLSQFHEAAGPISVLSIDCNWPSSVEAALDAAADYLQAGTIVYLDDYFVATRAPNFHDPIMEKAAAKSGFCLREFQTYPPCARAFIAEPLRQAQ